MVATAPHYLLLTESRNFGGGDSRSGVWRFLLKRIDGPESLEVSESEPGINGERLQLLAVIRGLEAIGQPSRVTLVTTSQYVTRGIRRDLGVWREMNWTWERFGELHPIKHLALWRRLDHALQFHIVQCRSWRLAGGVTRIPETDEAPVLSGDVATRPTPAQWTRPHRAGVLRSCLQMARRMTTRSRFDGWSAANPAAV